GKNLIQDLSRFILYICVLKHSVSSFLAVYAFIFYNSRKPRVTLHYSSLVKFLQVHLVQNVDILLVRNGADDMSSFKQLSSIEENEAFIQEHQLSFLYISRDNCCVCQGLL